MPEWKWDKITMDFVTGLAMMFHKNNVIWVIVDHLTKSTHFISLTKFTKLYVREVVKLHGVPFSIVTDRDRWFTSRL